LAKRASFLETINYDLPNAPESCVHRIGRPARAGRSGVAISFCDAEERAYLRDIETLIRTRIKVVTDHPLHAGPIPLQTQAGQHHNKSWHNSSRGRGGQRQDHRGRSTTRTRTKAEGKAHHDHRPHGNGPGAQRLARDCRPSRNRRWLPDAPAA
jgi:ATP-dependent RNA helicase RhlE